MKKLTIKEAIDQGYTKYGLEGREWQSVEDLHDDVFEEQEEANWDDLVLFEKDASYPSIDSDTIAEKLAEQIAENDAEECQRNDDDVVYNAVKAIDYTEIADKINKELEQFKYWMLTDIKLIK